MVDGLAVTVIIPSSRLLITVLAMPLPAPVFCVPPANWPRFSCNIAWIPADTAAYGSRFAAELTDTEPVGADPPPEAPPLLPPPAPLSEMFAATARAVRGK